MQKPWRMHFLLPGQAPSRIFAPGKSTSPVRQKKQRAEPSKGIKLPENCVESERQPPHEMLMSGGDGQPLSVQLNGAVVKLAAVILRLGRR